MSGPPPISIQHERPQNTVCISDEIIQSQYETKDLPGIGCHEAGLQNICWFNWCHTFN